jgi:hypothetical protein
MISIFDISCCFVYRQVHKYFGVNRLFITGFYSPDSSENPYVPGFGARLWRIAEIALIIFIDSHLYNSFQVGFTIHQYSDSVYFCVK